MALDEHNYSNLMVTKLRTKPTKVPSGVSRLGNPYFASYFSTNEHKHNLRKGKSSQN